MGQCRNGDDEHKRIDFAVIITITLSFEQGKHNPYRHKNTIEALCVEVLKKTNQLGEN